MPQRNTPQYSRERKAEAIALARVLGVARAARDLGIDARTVSSWIGAAGLSAGDSLIDTDELGRFERLAYAKLERELVSGQMKGNRLATSWGIVRDKLDRRARMPAPEPTPPPSAAHDWLDEITPIVEERFPVVGRRALFALVHRLEDLGGATVPELDVLLTGIPDDRDELNAWYLAHDCPSAKHGEPYVPHIDAETVELLAAADLALQEMTP